MEEIYLKKGSKNPFKRGGSSLLSLGNSEFILIGGANRSEEFGDFWKLELLSIKDSLIKDQPQKNINLEGKWTLLNIPLNSFTPRTGQCTTVAQENKIYIYGGQNFQQNKHYDDFFIFDQSQNSIQRINKQKSLSLEEPCERNSASLCFDQQNNTLLLFGGADSQEPLADLRIYDIKNNKWRLQNTKSTVTPKGLEMHTAHIYYTKENLSSKAQKQFKELPESQKSKARVIDINLGQEEIEIVGDSKIDQKNAEKSQQKETQDYKQQELSQSEEQVLEQEQQQQNEISQQNDIIKLQKNSSEQQSINSNTNNNNNNTNNNNTTKDILQDQQQQTIQQQQQQQTFKLNKVDIVFDEENAVREDGNDEEEDVDDEEFNSCVEEEKSNVQEQQQLLFGYMIVVGGRYQDQIQDKIMALDLKSYTWFILKQLPIPLCAHSSEIIDDTIYIFGGTDGTQFLSSLYLYNLSQNKLYQAEIKETVLKSLNLNGKMASSMAYDKQSKQIIIFGGSGYEDESSQILSINIQKINCENGVKEC